MNNKILLALMPYWTPLIPPVGIASLKAFLQPEGFNVKTVDFNTDQCLDAYYHRYFKILRENIPTDKLGNFYNSGHDVLQNHMTAHLSHTRLNDEDAYRRLIAAVVEQNYGCTIHHDAIRKLNGILDDFYKDLETRSLELIAREKPDVLGLSVFRGTFAPSLFAFRRVREEYPHITTVMGGPIFSQELDTRSPGFADFLKSPAASYIDAFIAGEGEKLFLKYLKGELPPNQKVYTLQDIANTVLDLSSAPAPDFSDFDTTFYPTMPAYTSRSCPFQCSFCAETTYWGTFRKKNVSQVVSELETLHRTHRRQLFLMCDSLLNPIATPLARQLSGREIPLFWDGYLRADKDACSVENTLLWRKGGFYRARLGIESGAPHVLELMGKKITPQQIKDAISNLAYAGIKTTTYWVIGHPGETETDFQQTLDIIEELKDDIYEAECNPFRYFLTGQVNSDTWMKNQTPIPLYPDTPQTRKMLLLQTYVLNGDPSHNETIDRVNRFVTHCRRLDIPNPYTMEEIKTADNRWKKLHPNAVPTLLDFNAGFDHPVTDINTTKELLTDDNKFQEDGDFLF